MGCDNLKQQILQSPRPTQRKYSLYKPEDLEIADRGFYTIETKRSYHHIEEGRDLYIDDLILEGVLNDCPTPSPGKQPDKIARKD